MPSLKGSDTEANLRSALAGETFSYTDAYPEMARTAREEGFGEIADWLEMLAKAERSHATRIHDILDALRQADRPRLIPCPAPSGCAPA